MSSSSAPPPSSKSPPVGDNTEPFFFDGFGCTAGDLTGSSSTGVAGSSDLLDRPNRSAPPGNSATPPTGFFFLQRTINEESQKNYTMANNLHTVFLLKIQHL